jgi:hypothetical protein
MSKHQEFSKYAESNVEVESLKNVLSQMPVQEHFKEGLIKHLHEKGLLKNRLCNSLILGVAFAEYVNKKVDPKSDDDMKDFYISRAILSNEEILPVVGMRG